MAPIQIIILVGTPYVEKKILEAANLLRNHQFPMSLQCLLLYHITNNNKVMLY